MCISRVFKKVQVCVHVSTPAFFPTLPPTWKYLVQERHIFLLRATFLQPTPTILSSSFTLNLKWWFPKGISYSRLSFSGSMLNFALVPCTSAVQKQGCKKVPTFPFPCFDSRAFIIRLCCLWFLFCLVSRALEDDFTFFVRGLQFQFQTFPDIFEKLVFLMLEFWLKMYIKIVVPIRNISNIIYIMMDW